MNEWRKAGGGKRRKLGGREVRPVGLGCMNIAFAYGGQVSDAEATALFQAALDEGYDHFDTAAIYGLGRSERLIGEAISHRRSEFTLASKCVLCFDEDGKRRLDGSPARIRATAEGALKRLKTDHIDLYYLHRPDPDVPVEDSMGEMSRLVEEGKIGAIGLSEMSSDWIRRAHAVHPVSALQTEYSLWTRNPEIAALDTCRELGITFVAFSPLGRQFLTGALRDPSLLEKGDLRVGMPRFEAGNFARNWALLEEFELLAGKAGCSMAQLALAWLLAQGPRHGVEMVAIPGTRDPEHMRENFNAGGLEIEPEVVALADHLINRRTVSGNRYSDQMQAAVGTERFAEETAGH